MGADAAPRISDNKHMVSTNVFNAVMSVDDSGQIISWNPGAEAIFGWLPNEVIGKNFHKTLFPAHSHDTYSNKTVLGRHIKQLALHRSGRIFPIEIYLTSNGNNNGKAFTAFIRDTTEFNGREELIRHADENQNIVNSILHISLEPVSLQEKLERALHNILSLRNGLLLCAGAIFLIDNDPDILELKAQQDLHREHQTYYSEIRVGKKDRIRPGQEGETKYVDRMLDLHNIQFHDSKPYSHYWVPILVGEKLFGIIALYTQKGHKRKKVEEDFLMTIAESLAVAIERNKMEHEHAALINNLQSMITDLKNEKKFTESVIQSLNSGLMVLDHDGAIITCNSRGQRILSHFVPNIEGENLCTIFGDKTARKITQSDRAISYKGLEISLQTKSGEERILGIKAAPREDASGQKVGLIVSFIDITDTKYFRQEIEKMNRLSTVAEIASAVAHEVRNPLAGIKTMSQSIEENLDDEDENKEYIKRIIKQVDRLNQLLSEFFTYAKPGEPKKIRTSLIDIINDTRPLIKVKLDKKNIGLKELYEKDLPQIVADPNQLQQVFLNLMLNSIDALDCNGTIEITANHLQQKERKEYQKIFPSVKDECEYVVARFKDNGPGMTPEVAENVFEPFFTTKHNGAGLGLSIVYRILKENNAAIYVECSKPGATTFIIFFEADRKWEKSSS